MYKIPPDGQWVQNNKSDRLGVLAGSFNIDLKSNLGNLRVSPRTIINTDDISGLGVPESFVTFTDSNGSTQYFWCVAGASIFRATTTNGYITAFTVDTSTNTPTTVAGISDLATFGANAWMVTTSGTTVYRFNPSTSTWNAGSSTLGAGTAHILCVYGTKFYVTNNNTQVYSFTPANYNSITTSGTGTIDLSLSGLPVSIITSIREVTDGIWIFTLNQNENGCYAFKWDGDTANVARSYLIPDSSGIMASVIKDNTPWVIDNNARLLYFNGGSFVEAPNGRLPVKYAKYLKNSVSGTNNRWIHHRGIALVDGRIRIFINNEYGDYGTTISEFFPSGIWEYDESTGWVHIASPSLYTSSITDYGQNRISQVGALYPVKDDANSSTANGTMLIGAQLYSDASTTKEVILYDDTNDTLQKYGYFVTVKIHSNNIKESWNTIYAIIKKLLSSTDSIVIKYRTTDVEPVEGTITWLSTSSFTTTADLSTFVEGDEVEVLQGTGSGKCAHISTISGPTASTYTITLDDTYTGVTGTAKARFQKWAKLVSSTDQNIQIIQSGVESVYGSVSPWVQFKVCMQFTGKNEFEYLLLDTSKKQ